MKTLRAFCITACLFAAFFPASAPRALADDQMDREAVQDLLTSGSWKITYAKGWSIIRIFDKGGAFGTPGRPDESGRWKIIDGTVVQTFADGRKDIFTLPLDPKGTAGLAKDGEKLNAAHDDSAPPPLPTPAPSLDEDAKAAIAALLTSGPWKVVVGTWSTIRICNKDGTFTTDGSSERGRWKIADGMVTLLFTDGHKDFFILPLDTKGTVAVLEDGESGAASVVHPAVGAPADAPTPPPSLLASLATPAPTPTPLDENAREANVALLVSNPWKIIGGGWSEIRVFNKNGTFTTPGSADAGGHWKISNTTVILTFADGHKDTISLPLDPKGTPGTDKGGGPVKAVMVTPAEAIAAAGTPTPKPAAAWVSTEENIAANIALLVSGPWKISGSDWSDTRIFAKNGTFTTVSHLDEHGHWRVSGRTIILTFADDHQDTLSLPLDPAGTPGTSLHGATTAVLVNAPAAKTASVPASPPPSVATAPPMPATAPIATPRILSQPASDLPAATSPDATTALLLSAPWRLSTKAASAVRVFMQDGTFKTLNGAGGNGRWAITKDLIILIFPNGHKEAITLPLSPQGATGMADNGDTITALLLTPGVQ